MKKLVVELELYDEKTKQKAMQTVSGLSGIQLIQIEQKNKKLTVIGDIDPVCVVEKLRKHCHTTIVSVGPAQEAKKEEPKKEEAKKQDDKKDGPKDPVAELVKAYQAYNPYMTTHYYVRSAEEDPNSCVIC